MKCVSRQAKKKQELERGAEVLATVITMICYVIHKNYDWDRQMLQDLIDEVYQEIIKADNLENKDWVKGVQFWRDRMGLKI